MCSSGEISALLAQNLGHHLVNQNQAAGHMEGALEGRTLAGRQGGIAVSAQIAVPLAVLVGKVDLAVVENLIENIQKIGRASCRERV